MITIEMSQKDWVDILTAIAQILIAAAVAYVAFRSYFLSKESHRLSLFDKRYNVFSVIKKFFDNFIISATVENKNLSEFIIGTVEVDFLFGADIADYKNEVIEKSIQLIQIHSKFNRGIQDKQERERLANESMELETWFAIQGKEIKEIFKKYLCFDL